MSPVRIRSPAPYFCPPNAMNNRLSPRSLCWLPSAFAQDYKLEPIATAAPGSARRLCRRDSDPGLPGQRPRGRGARSGCAKSIPSGAKPTDAAIVLPDRSGHPDRRASFPGKGADRRGQSITAASIPCATATFRWTAPTQGVAPQRDFALLTPIAADPGSGRHARLSKKLVKMSGKASGTPHPAVLSLEPPPTAPTFPALVKEGEHDWA